MARAYQTKGEALAVESTGARRPSIRPDLLPEWVRYHDTGCGGECVRNLECPFPQCVHDAPEKDQAAEALTLRQRIRQERDRGGMTPIQIGVSLGISVKTVYRALRGA